MGGKQTKSESKLDKKAVSRLQSLVKGELSEDEIQCCYKTYQESRCSNKELTKDEFKKIYGGLFQCDATEFADHVFRTFDVNNDGTVDFQEFLLGLCLSGSKDAETKITWAFKVYDIDGDGTISWSEMRNIIQSVCNITSESMIDQLAEELTNQVDPSKPHMLNSRNDDVNMYQKRDRVDEIADRIFWEMDSDKDGFITLEEFRDGALKMPVVLSLLDNCFD